jgi:hypothetical protein
MSDERRKRQQERDPVRTLIPRKYLTWGAILILFAAAYYAGWYHKNHKYDVFAKCLADKHAKMYGLYYCPHCADQKAMFLESFHHVPYVECAIKGTREEAPECVAAGVKLFPSWQFGTDPPKPGILSLDTLSQKTGCSLP